MLARHPKTGAPIRILNLNTSIHKDAKTLVWVTRDTLGAEPKRWTRWDVGVPSLDDWFAAREAGLEQLTACLVLGAQPPLVREWLAAGGWKTCKLVALTRDTIAAIGFDAVKQLGVNNMVCLEDLTEVYPFLQVAWDGTERAAKLLIALLLRYSVTLPVATASSESHTLDTVASEFGLRVESELRAPKPLWFLTQYFEPPRARRAKEIRTCLERNVASPWIDRVVLLNERHYALGGLGDSKVEQVIVGERLRFSAVIRWIQESAPADAIIVFANADIYLDNSARLLWSVDLKNRFLSMLRWDDQEDPAAQPVLFGPRADSQDTWAVSAADVKARTWDWAALDFPFGQNGCDNAINVEMLKQKFLVVNPALSIRTRHVHMSGLRTYDPTDIVTKPMYMHIHPTAIHDLKPDANPPSSVLTTVEDAPYRIDGYGLTVNQKETYLTMLKRKHTVEADGTIVGRRAIPVYTLSNCFETRDGGVYTYNSIVTGGTKASQEAWSKTDLSIVAASMASAVALVAPCPDEIANNPYRYILEYLGKILVLQDRCGSGDVGEFLGTQSAASQAALVLFRWPHDSPPVISRSQPFQLWCKTAHIWFPQDGSAAAPTALEVAALRAALATPWIPVVPKQKKAKLIAIADDAWVTPEWTDALERELDGKAFFDMILPSTSLIDAVELLRGATGVVILGGKSLPAAANLLWVLPAEAIVWELQPELDPSFTVGQLASVCGLDHRLVSVPRARPQVAADGAAARKAILASVGVARPKPNPGAPTILLPAAAPGSNPFYNHAGDSFREMAVLWAERGYVNVKSVPGLAQVWLGGIGGTLLYDRPTLEWLERAPLEESKWKRALFGNPTPPADVSGAAAWSFWPRRPRLVEELVAAGVGTASFAKRTLSCVFYGRSENAVQRGHRTQELWDIACSEFVHVEGSASYPFTQREYLERLATARWGLCLAGYGRKCHREIECMAMGCVPLVAPEVDMESYAEPPVEGTHFFRVKSPSDLLARLSIVTEADWARMSAACRDWWQRNASAEGMWALTKRLAFEN